MGCEGLAEDAEDAVADKGAEGVAKEVVEFEHAAFRKELDKLDREGESKGEEGGPAAF